MTGRLTESTVEPDVLAWLGATGWRIAHGPDISPAGDTLSLTFPKGGEGTTAGWSLTGELRVPDAEKIIQRQDAKSQWRKEDRR